MNDINKFQELLKKTLEIAKNQKNRMEVQTIKDIFAEWELSDSQLDEISGYLAANQIEVAGYVQPEELKILEKNSDPGKPYEPKKINSKDSVYLKDYLEELAGITEGSREEEIRLLHRMKQGDSAAKQRYIELNLRRVVEIAEEYKNRGMTAEDLIQEGNMALIQSIQELPAADDIEQVQRHVYETIRDHLAESVKEQQENDTMENAVMKKMNRLYASLKKLESQLGRKANITELADYMKITEDEIQDILELSADTITLGEHKPQDHHSYQGHNHHQDHGCSCHENDK